MRCLLFGLLIGVSGTVYAQTGDKARIEPGFTLPYLEYNVCFPTMGVIKEVKVKDGDVVSKGQVLMVQKDDEEQAELKILEIDAKSDLPIKAAIAKRDVAKVEFDGKDRMKKAGNAFVDLEWARAKAELDVAELQVKQSEQELEQKQAKRDKQATRVANMSMRSPADGVVKQVVNQEGSNVDPTRPSIVVVQNNPLLVQVSVPALASLQLKKGDKMKVSYDKKEWKEASVSFLSPEADAGSGLRVVKLELPNPNGDPAGLQIFVELPEKLVASVGQ